MIMIHKGTFICTRCGGTGHTLLFDNEYKICPECDGKGYGIKEYKVPICYSCIMYGSTHPVCPYINERRYNEREECDEFVSR